MRHQTTGKADVDTITLRRDGDRSLVFDGVLLGSGSSKREGVDRWFEVEVYRTAGGRYVIAGRGMSQVEGEVNRCWAVDVDEPRDVLRELTRVDGEGVEYLTRTARDALSRAADEDEGIRNVFLKRVA